MFNKSLKIEELEQKDLFAALLGDDLGGGFTGAMGNSGIFYDPPDFEEGFTGGMG